MARISTLFWDIGGVLLSNGWDRDARLRAAESFLLDPRAFEERHQACVTDFEIGQLSLDAYLVRTVLLENQAFSADDFKAFMYAQSRPNAEMIDLARSIRVSGRYLMATLNNESLELNRYRIEKFGLRSLFSLFLSSCFLGVRKPDERIYEIALQITQTESGEALLIDDREENLDTARRLGFQTIHCQGSAREVREGLNDRGVFF